MAENPPKYQLLNEKDMDEVRKYHNRPIPGWLQVGENKTIVPNSWAEHGESIWRVKIRPTDLWMITFPRSGSTWTQELVWLLNNDLNYELASKIHISDRFYFLEFDMLNPEVLETGENKKLTGDKLEALPSPRFIRSHLPFDLLPPGLLDSGCKVIYVARNPKNVIVSFYYLKSSRINERFTGDFATFYDLFERNLDFWTPYWSHVKEAWKRRDHPNLFFVFYEDMKMNMPDVIKKMSEFYDRPCTDEEIAKLTKHLEFESFRENPMIGARQINGQDSICKKMYIRKGEIGGWDDLMTPEIEARVDKWMEKNLADTTLEFPHMPKCNSVKTN